MWSSPALDTAQLASGGPPCPPPRSLGLGLAVSLLPLGTPTHPEGSPPLPPSLETSMEAPSQALDLEERGSPISQVRKQRLGEVISQMEHRAPKAATTGKSLPPLPELSAVQRDHSTAWEISASGLSWGLQAPPTPPCSPTARPFLCGPTLGAPRPDHPL